MANVPITLGGGASADLDAITAGAGQILSPYVGLNQDGDPITGTIPSLGATTWYPSTSTQTIASGRYLSGTQTISAVSNTNLAAANIKKGTTITIKAGNNTIYSVTGTWEGYVPGNADAYKQGAWYPTQHNVITGTAGTTIINAGFYSNVGTGYYRVQVAFGKFNAIGYTKLIITGYGLAQYPAGGGLSCRYKSTMPTSKDDGTDAIASSTVTSSAITFNLTAAAINSGNTYWTVGCAAESNGYVNRIYLA